MARMPKLTDLQMILLSTAAAREDGNVLPVKGCIGDKTAEIAKAINPLLRRALVVEQPETVLVRVWRKETDGRIGLVITEAGRALIDGTGTGPAPNAGSVNNGATASPTPDASAPRAGSKIDTVLALLQRDDGATSGELIDATGWLPHTMRAALTGLRKKGHVVERSKRGDATCYRVVAGA